MSGGNRARAERNRGTYGIVNGLRGKTGEGKGKVEAESTSSK